MLRNEGEKVTCDDCCLPGRIRKQPLRKSVVASTLEDWPYMQHVEDRLLAMKEGGGSSATVRQQRSKLLHARHIRKIESGKLPANAPLGRHLEQAIETRGMKGKAAVQRYKKKRNRIDSGDQQQPFRRSPSPEPVGSATSSVIDSNLKTVPDSHTSGQRRVCQDDQPHDAAVQQQGAGRNPSLLAQQHQYQQKGQRSSASSRSLLLDSNGTGIRNSGLGQDTNPSARSAGRDSATRNEPFAARPPPGNAYRSSPIDGDHHSAEYRDGGPSVDTAERRHTARHTATGSSSQELSNFSSRHGAAKASRSSGGDLLLSSVSPVHGCGTSDHPGGSEFRILPVSARRPGRHDTAASKHGAGPHTTRSEIRLSFSDSMVSKLELPFMVNSNEQDRGATTDSTSTPEHSSRAHSMHAASTRPHRYAPMFAAIHTGSLPQPTFILRPPYALH